MIERLRTETEAEYEAFVQHHPKGHFAQSLAWAAQKADWTHEALISRAADGSIRGTMLILFRSAGCITMAYSCRGPVCDIHDMETLQELLTAAEQLCRKRRAVALRIDPDVPAADADYAAALQSLGFQAGSGGNLLDQSQAKHVFRLSLAG